MHIMYIRKTKIFDEVKCLFYFMERVCTFFYLLFRPVDLIKALTFVLMDKFCPCFSCFPENMLNLDHDFHVIDLILLVWYYVHMYLFNHVL